MRWYYYVAYFFGGAVRTARFKRHRSALTVEEDKPSPGR